jgi:hypothetical protein
MIQRVELLCKFENRKLLPLIEDHIVEYHKITQDSNEKRVIHYILATVKSLKFRFNFEEEAVLIVNFKKYLEITNDEIKKWENYEKQDIRKNIKETMRIT